MRYIGLIALFFFTPPSFGQEGYPVPPATAERLFYIQHSQNHNTYVYDAKMDGRNLDSKKPVVEYRIVYTEGGVRKPLTLIQRKMAYGMTAKYISENYYEMQLAASKQSKFYLMVDAQGAPRVFVIVNNRKMYLDRLFIKIQEGSGGFRPKVEYVLFEGTDFGSGERIKEIKEIVK